MNKIIILFCLLVILVFIYINLPRISEGFKSNKVKLELIDSEKASEIIRDIKTFNKYNRLDKELRNIKKNDNIYAYYINNLANWNNTEVELLNWLKKGLIEKTPKKYQFLFDNVFVAKYNNNIEMGFPHTHGNTIFLTSLFVKEILPFFTNNNIDDCIKRVGSVLIHEAVHIWQRRDKQFFMDLYNSWNFKYYSKIYNFSKLSKKNRYNPDGVNLKWGWKYTDSSNEIIPMAVYSRGATNISHVNLIGVRLEKIGSIPVIPPILDFKRLSNIPEFIDFFGDIVGNNYHPNELSAEIISRIITKEILGDKYNNDNDTLNTDAVKEFKQLFN